MRTTTVVMSAMIAIQGYLTSGATANINLKDVKPVPSATYASLKGLAPGSRKAQNRQKQWVSKLGLPLEVETKKAGIKLRLVPPGTFTMGSSMSEQEKIIRSIKSSSYPTKTKEIFIKIINGETQHRVTLTKAFYCGKFEVTQGQWKLVMGSNPSKFTGAGDNSPVEKVSYEDCQKFLTKLC
jgi:formylglycine-generating enzyme required for sulfatase activity